MSRPPSAPPRVTIGGDAGVTEGADAEFTLTASKPVLSSNKPLNVSVSVSESEDMVASAEEGAKTVSFAVDATTATLSVPTVDDGVRRESNSVVSAAIQTNTDYTVGTDSSATVTVSDDTPPGAPTGLTATEGHHAIRLDWTAPADPGSSPIMWYQGIATGGSISVPRTFTATTDTSTSYTTGVLAGGSYTFQVRAVNGEVSAVDSADKGPWSDAVTGTIGPATVTIAGDGGVTEGTDCGVRRCWRRSRCCRRSSRST